jgi:hypothetical protein
VRLSQESSRLYFPLSPFHLSQRSDRRPSQNRDTDDRLSCAYFSRPCMTSDCHALQPTQRYDARDRGTSPLSIPDIIDIQQMSMYFFAAQAIPSLFLRYSILLRSMFPLTVQICDVILALPPCTNVYSPISSYRKHPLLHKAQRIKELFLLNP